MNEVVSQARQHRQPSRVRVILLAAGLAGAGLAGCSENASAPVYKGNIYPTKGKVELANGKPLAGGRVVFLPKDASKTAASGDIGSDGTYSLKTPDGRDGAADGEYKVRIEPSAEMFKKNKQGGVALNSLPFDHKYTDEDGDTDLTATVKAEPTEVPPFKLNAPGAAAASKRASRDRD